MTRGPESIHVTSPSGELHALRWGERAVDRPVVVLTQGLGFVGAIWSSLAEQLCETHTVYALDRRGHGRSAPARPDDLRFAVFADDVIRFAAALEITGAIAIGHSAGATDLLLAEAGRPGTFSAMLAYEPTVQDPSGPRLAEPALSEVAEMVRERTRRRPVFENAERTRHHLATRSTLRNWDPRALEAYVEHGFEAAPDGKFRPRCSAELEAEMLLPIFQAMECRYPGDEFEALAAVSCPVLVVTGTRTEPVFAQMARICARLLPHARLETVRDASHFEPYEQPARFAALVQPWLAQTPKRGSPCN